MQNNTDTAIDFRTIFPEVFERDWFEIASIIEGELSELVYEEILPESPTDVYVVERKGVNLFHPFFNTIVERHHIGSIRSYKISQIVRIKGYTPTDAKESILLTDAIGSGDEVSTICTILNDLKIPIYKVCGYIAKKKSINELQKRFPQITFKFIHEVEDYETYKKVLWMLTPVYHSRLEPLDSEHPFYLYRFTSKIGGDIANSIIVRTCSKLFGGNFSVQEGSMRINEDGERRSDDIVGFTVEYDSPDSIMENIISKEQKTFFQIERLLLRFVFDTSKSRLRAMAFCSPIDVDINRFRNNEVDCRNFLSRIYCDTFEKDIAHEVICPLCIDTNMSIKILDKFEDKLQLITEKAGYKVINVGRYDPFKNI